MAARDRRDALSAWQLPAWYEASERGGSHPDPATEETIVEFVNKACWEEWEGTQRAWRRQVEENVRMVTGRQYDQFIEQIGDFVDLSTWFVSQDEMWRQYPVFNWLAHYYKLTLSKLTENLPTMGFVPGSADWKDAVMAQVMEPVWRYQWHQMKMPEQMFRLYGWVILAARAITRLRWDPDRGPAEQFRAPATLEQVRGGAVSQRTYSDAPYIRNTEGLFVPAFERDAAGEVRMGEDGEPLFGDPYSSRVGDLAFDVLTPTSVLTHTGPEPFDEKLWYTHEYWLPVEEARRRFGVQDLEPDEMTAEDNLSLKLAFGQNFGMPGSFAAAVSLGQIEGVSLRDMLRVREHWRRDVPNHPLVSRGRTIVCSKDKVLYDDINPYWVDGSHEQVVMPFDAFDAVPFPARQQGMGDYEILNPIQRAMNRRLGGAMEAIDYFEQPTEFYNENIIDEEQAEHIGKPGARIPANMIPSLGVPIYRNPPGEFPRASIEMAEVLQQWMQLLGSQPFGSEGVPVTKDASGELQREVRFDTDRVWGATIRLHSYAWARIAEKMGGILAACMDDERLMVLSGEDQAPEFVTVAPEMFSGRVHVYPNPESQVLESRQEKQNRIMALVSVGLPVEQALLALNYPDLNRVLRPGGPAYAMAVQENMEMMWGQLPTILPEHDHVTHLLVHRRQMQGPGFRDAPPEVHQLYRIHIFMHEQMGAAEQIRQGALLQQVAGALTPATEDGTSGAPGGGGGASGAAASPEGKAPRGEDLARGAVAPGAADPRRASIELVS